MHRQPILTSRVASSNHRRRAAITAAILLVALTDVLAQTTKPAAAPAPASATAEPRYNRTLPIPEEMIRRRPRQVIALPSEPGEPGEDPLQLSSGVLGKVTPDAHRLPEGYVLAGVQASIEQQPDWLVCYVPDRRIITMDVKDAAGWPADLDGRRIPAGLVRACQDKGLQIATEARVVVEEPGRCWRLADPRCDLFVQKDQDAIMVRAALPLRVLPNKTAMVLEAIISNTDKPPAFGITGRIAEFQGNNYILLEHLTEAAAVSPSPAQGVTAEPTASQPAATSAPAGRDPRPEDIIKQLLESKPRRAVVLPKSASASAQTVEKKPGGPVAEGRSEQQTWPEETMIVDRPGRMVPSGKWWTFSFEDKSAAPGRKPIRLLPNRMLENAIVLGGEKSIGAVLVVSGEITEHRGANYLLLRKVLVQRDMGNLR